MMENKRPFMILAAILWIGTIFWFSLHTGKSSHVQSQDLTAILRPIAHKVGIHNRNLSVFSFLLHPKDMSYSELLIRKLGHFFEYMVLGALIGINLFYPRNGKPRIWIPLCGIAVALVDELVVQAFFTTGRTSSPVDVVIDCSGYFLTLLILKLISHILFRKKAIRNES